MAENIYDKSIIQIDLIGKKIHFLTWICIKCYFGLKKVYLLLIVPGNEYNNMIIIIIIFTNATICLQNYNDVTFHLQEYSWQNVGTDSKLQQMVPLT
jgi:hypothetical protein